ncbi:MAG: hypothetical protein HETSPECPRED_008004 [Heterodermia speciosa]|uniref:Heat shock protein 70 n=1 Tax=Heterodermia speciosa TaxID=116794 RepID=A0A8H3EMI6_9LECA|nr:MAG: hypothetical protein HETSPECPRED_008004 [Heterodermia speciosa]
MVVGQVLGNDSYKSVFLEAMQDKKEQRHPNSTKEIFTEALISIKAEAEQALAREVGCSVIAIPDYFDNSARDAIAAAAVEVAFASSEPKHIIAASEAIRLAYDFGECSGRHIAKGCDLDKEFITLVVDLTPTSLTVMIVNMGKESATVLGHEELPDNGEFCIEPDGTQGAKQPQSACTRGLEEGLASTIAKLTTLDEAKRTEGLQSTPFIKDVNAVILIGNASPASHESLSAILIKLLHEHLGTSEDWFFQVIDPSQVVSIGAARRAKALVDKIAPGQTTTETRDEL